MRKIITILFAAAAVLGLSAGPALAAPTIPTVTVSQSSLNATLNVLSSCGTQTTNVDYNAPAVPAFVAAAVKTDGPGGKYSPTFAGTRWAGDYLTANSLPITIFTKAITRTYNVGGTLQTVKGIGHTWHAFIPGYRGTSCNVWTKVVARDF